jgi:hypothetical protein
LRRWWYLRQGCEDRDKTLRGYLEEGGSWIAFLEDETHPVDEDPMIEELTYFTELLSLHLHVNQNSYSDDFAIKQFHVIHLTATMIISLGVLKHPLRFMVNIR